MAPGAAGAGGHAFGGVGTDSVRLAAHSCAAAAGRDAEAEGAWRRGRGFDKVGGSISTVLGRGNVFFWSLLKGSTITYGSWMMLDAFCKDQSTWLTGPPRPGLFVQENKAALALGAVGLVGGAVAALAAGGALRRSGSAQWGGGRNHRLAPSRSEGPRSSSRGPRKVLYVYFFFLRFFSNCMFSIGLLPEADG